MIIEHEDNPSWAVSSPPPRTTHRRLDPIGAKAAVLHQNQPRAFKPSIASFVIFGMVIVSMLLSGLASGLTAAG